MSYEIVSSILLADHEDKLLLALNSAFGRGEGS
jgi:hypothetical protein